MKAPQPDEGYEVYFGYLSDILKKHGKVFAVIDPPDDPKFRKDGRKSNVTCELTNPKVWLEDDIPEEKDCGNGVVFWHVIWRRGRTGKGWRAHRALFLTPDWCTRAQNKLQALKET